MSRKSPSSRRATRRARRGLSGAGWVSILTTALVIGGSLAAYGAYYDIYNNIDQETIDTDSFENRPDKVEGAMNILLIGSDVRTGANSEYGDAEGERPDTLIIAHISPRQEGATLVNLPRDSLVDLPSCESTGDKPGMAAQHGMINSPMTFGGIQCQFKAVEQVTGIHIDHFISVDFTGFKEVINALGGVEMCIPEPIDDPKAKLTLDAGRQKLKGEDALGFVRARYSLGDGTDTARIKRQQEFMGAMVRKATSSEILASPANLYDFLGSVTDSITTDDELTVETMAELAFSMRDVNMDNIQFITVPNGAHPQNENRLAWKQPEAGQLFEAVAQDADLTDRSDDGDGEDGDGEDSDEAEEQAPTVPPEDVSVEILNATDAGGLAGEAAEELTDQGFVVAGTGNHQGEPPEETTVYHGPGYGDHADTVSSNADGAAVAEDPALGATLRLVLAEDWEEAHGDDVLDSVDSKSAAKTESACD